MSRKILRKLSNLSTNLGVGAGARKHEVNREGRRLTNQEKQWIEYTLIALIRRVGEVAHDANKELPKITLADQPGLETPPTADT